MFLDTQTWSELCYLRNNVYRLHTSKEESSYQWQDPQGLQPMEKSLSNRSHILAGSLVILFPHVSSVWYLMFVGRNIQSVLLHKLKWATNESTGWWWQRRNQRTICPVIKHFPRAQPKWRPIWWVKSQTVLFITIIIKTPNEGMFLADCCSSL